MEIELTKEEKLAIEALKRVAKRWPDTLWLFSASGTLTVMRCGDNGEHMYSPNQSVDQEYVVDTIGIDNDGGDF